MVNTTPDSFSDGGRFQAPESATAHALKLVEEGAEILDIGGESTRPGAKPVPPDEELRRTILVIESLARLTDVPLSIDTSKAVVADAALSAGAHIVNDVTSLADAHMIETVRKHAAGVVLMHMQGTPQTMQLAPTYIDVVQEIRDYLEKRMQLLESNGVSSRSVVIDPGIGFGKTLEHNLTLLQNLVAFQALGRPLLIGVSRKGFINRVLGQSGRVEQGVGGTIGTLLAAQARQAVQVVRVHDVREVRAAVLLFDRLQTEE
jgi:dihydropteroate synthase